MREPAKHAATSARSSFRPEAARPGPRPAAHGLGSDAARRLGRAGSGRPGRARASAAPSRRGPRRRRRRLGAVSMICLNALGYQTGRHPAPIFPKLSAKTRPRRAPPRPDEAGCRPRSRGGASPSRGAEARDPKARGTEARPGTPRAARRGTASARSSSRPASRPARRDHRLGDDPRRSISVAQAQRALVKLGYGPLEGGRRDGRRHPGGDREVRAGPQAAGEGRALAGGPSASSPPARACRPGSSIRPGGVL